MTARFIPTPTRFRLSCMKGAQLLGLCLILAAGPASAGPTVEEEGPLGPCVEGGGSNAAQAQSGPAWGVEIATSFNKQEALDDFARVQKQYSDLLGQLPAADRRGLQPAYGHLAAILGKDRHR